MNILSLLVFGALGIILDVAFGYQDERSKPVKKSPWYSKSLDMTLIVGVLLGVMMSIKLFPLGLLGLIAGAIFGWMMFNNSTQST